MQATTQYFVERFFYKQGLDYHRPSKILCQTSGRQNYWSLLRREGKLTAHKSTCICRTILMKVTSVRRIALWIAFYIPYIFFLWAPACCLFSSILYIEYNTSTTLYSVNAFAMFTLRHIIFLLLTTFSYKIFFSFFQQ